MRYVEYNDAEGKHGGPYITELTVLEREKRSAGVEEREPQYQQVLDDLYSGNLATQWEKPEIVKDAAGTVLNPEAEVWDKTKVDHEDITYDEPNSPVKQQERHVRVQDALLEANPQAALTSPYGNTGNTELIDEYADERAVREQPNVFDQGDEEEPDAATAAQASESRKASAGLAGLPGDPSFEGDDEDKDEKNDKSKLAESKTTAAKTTAAKTAAAKK